MNNRKESISRETQALSSGLHTVIVKIGLKHVISPPIYCPKWILSKSETAGEI